MKHVLERRINKKSINPLPDIILLMEASFSWKLL